MLKLNIQKGLKWLDLGEGVEVEVRPMTTQVRMEAHEHLARESVAEDAGASGEDDGKMSPARRVAFGKALACVAITDWRGVGDADGKPVAPSPEGIAALMDIYQFFSAFETQYLFPGILVAAEGNGSAPSPNGTTAGAPTTARRVKRAAKTAPRK